MGGQSPRETLPSSFRNFVCLKFWPLGRFWALSHFNNPQCCISFVEEPFTAVLWFMSVSESLCFILQSHGWGWPDWPPVISTHCDSSRDLSVRYHWQYPVPNSTYKVCNCMAGLHQKRAYTCLGTSCPQYGTPFQLFPPHTYIHAFCFKS